MVIVRLAYDAVIGDCFTDLVIDEEKTLFHVVDTTPFQNNTARPSTMPNLKQTTSFTKEGVFPPESWSKGSRTASDTSKSPTNKDVAQPSSLLRAKYAASDNTNQVLIDGKVYYTIGGSHQGNLPQQQSSTPRVRHSRMPSDPFYGTPTKPATDHSFSLPRSNFDNGPKIKVDHVEDRADARQTNHVPTAMPTPPLLAPSGLPDFPNFQLDREAGTRVDLPIPPPPLPVIRGRLTHDAAMRAKLDQEKTAREVWIRNGARQIAELNRAKSAAEQQYRRTGRREDMEAWQKAIAAFNDSTNLDKRQEERRNLFLPESMRPAMRVGEWNLPGDGAAAGGEGALLGFQMALMERYAAVVAESEQFLG
ncbi:hypothetical protein K491DRAFT_370315 [Lophiostoma macrostomum CBS 122681]|uniref:Uncharacterized protein n=1 Tax=Lophiostoma macrostomum CBS 122681 TaxID=1314788 RepID=A0A6A6TAG3_9PLEO|nr:hypothetical protein K491DRAFT_370315 [Lophiostoma macrostomum CBS 122681]